MSEVPLYLAQQPQRERGLAECGVYRGTSLIRNNPFLRPYSRTMSRAIWRP